jgi:type I restriction enzyme M protein
MLVPKEHEFVIDTAAGSSGFTVHTIFHVWKKIYEELGLPDDAMFTGRMKPARCVDYVREKVFAIDFDKKSVRVGRTLNLIAGDGQTNYLHLNTLDFERWHDISNLEEWADIYYEGFKKLKKLRVGNDS